MRGQKIIGLIIVGLVIFPGCAPAPASLPPSAIPTLPATEPPAAKLLAQPYPYTTPLPPPLPTELDGVYTYPVAFIGTPTPCRRCAPYRAEGGEWRLSFDRGVFRVTHSDTDFQGIGSFAVAGHELILFNDPHCHLDVGRYTWQRDGRRLRLTEVDDSCAFGLRRKNLASGQWLLQTDAAGHPLDPCQPPNQEAAVTGHWPVPAGCETQGAAK